MLGWSAGFFIPHIHRGEGKERKKYAEKSMLKPPGLELEAFGTEMS
jgi:hypothetical protein